MCLYSVLLFIIKVKLLMNKPQRKIYIQIIYIYICKNNKWWSCSIHVHIINYTIQEESYSDLNNTD